MKSDVTKTDGIGEIRFMDNEKDILWENEIKANKIMTQSSFVFMIAVVVFWILLNTGLFHMPNGKTPTLEMLTLILILSVTVFVSIRQNYEKRWIKYLLMANTTIVFAGLDAIFTYAVMPLMLVPMVLSTRYFSKVYTRRVVRGSFLVFLASTLWGANHGILDINSLEVPLGTTLTFTDTTIFSDVVDGIEYDHLTMLINVFKYNYCVKLIIALVAAHACISIAERGRALVLQQAELTERATRVSAELSLATKIQEDMLPRIFPAFPDINEVDLFASMTPEKEVGGDFYDFFLVDDDHLVLVIADVSGKGIPAAMFMMFSKNIIENCVMMGKSPGKALADANNDVCANNSEEMFVTVWLGVLEISTGRLTCANAGHEYPAVKRKNGKFELFKDKHGFPVGWFANTEYEEYEIDLMSGDVVFVYTDGITEAKNIDNKMFGEKGMIEALNSKCYENPKDTIETVHAFVNVFAGEAVQSDDLTMLALEYRG